jgi:hypothetical protein
MLDERRAALTPVADIDTYVDASDDGLPQPFEQEDEAETALR